jgi:threonine dehydratase
VTTIPTTGLIGPADVAAAAERIRDRVRRVDLSPVEPGTYGIGSGLLAYEFTQHTGSFKARGAANLAAFHVEAATMPEATGTVATVFVPTTAPAFKVAKLHGYGSTVRQVGTEYADALAGSIEFAQSSGALLSHAYDHPLIVAGAGTLAREIVEAAPDVDTIVVAVGGGGLFSGTAAAVSGMGKRIVVVEPENCCGLRAALEAGEPVDVTVDSVAADSLGARRVSQAAYDFASGPGVTSLLVTDDDIIRARQSLWDDRRIVAEHGGAAALAALQSGAYTPEPGERLAVILCGANTDPIDLINRS